MRYPKECITPDYHTDPWMKYELERLNGKTLNQASDDNLIIIK